ncbi:hypothetical protein ACFV1L_09970 [Kitasatospora sp. NPDC059646]|uniref:hypothetical protein n=1 Tax=Kitasatospora sp. NPDC059646 TaxID=3346893 RepID=UPI00369A99AD
MTAGHEAATVARRAAYRLRAATWTALCALCSLGAMSGSGAGGPLPGAATGGLSGGVSGAATGGAGRPRGGLGSGSAGGSGTVDEWR